MCPCYSFTSKEISDALLEAHQKEVKVHKTQRTHLRTQERKVTRQGITIFFDAQPIALDSKIIIADDKTVVSWLYNLTRSAEHRNDAENLIIVKNKDIIQHHGVFNGT